MVEKSSVCKKSYVRLDEDDLIVDDSRAKSWFDGADALEFAFSNGVTHLVRPEQFPESIKTRALPFFGISEKLGNGYAGATKKSVESGEAVGVVAEDMFSALLERLELGEFISERESAGPRISQMVTAIVNLKLKDGVESDPIAVALKLKDADTRANVEADPVVMAEVKRIRAVAAAEAAQKAADAAVGLVAGDSLDAF